MFLWLQGQDGVDCGSYRSWGLQVDFGVFGISANADLICKLQNFQKKKKKKKATLFFLEHDYYF